MTGQLSLTDWISTDERLPCKSGYYIVRDRKGREFRTWFERIIKGFDSTGLGKMHPSYSVTAWRYIGG